MTMAYARFRGATGLHGRSVKGWLAMELKELRAKRARVKLRRTMWPRYRRRRSWEGRRNRWSCRSWR